MAYFKQLITAITFRSKADNNRSPALMLFMIGDRFINAIGGGSGKHTVSARTGHQSIKANKYCLWFWEILEAIINWAFRPVDGDDHCFHAYWEEAKNYHEFRQGNIFTLAILGFLSIFACVWIAVFISAYALIKPKEAHINHQRSIVKLIAKLLIAIIATSLIIVGWLFLK